MDFKRWIKSRQVLVDREIGEAEITITLYSRSAKDYPTKITKKELKIIAEEGGADMLSIISGKNISNRKGEVTGTWLIKIPSTEPQNSTTAILKRREKRKNKNRSSNK